MPPDDSDVFCHLLFLLVCYETQFVLNKKQNIIHQECKLSGAMSQYSALPNKRTGTFIFLKTKVPPGTQFFLRYAN